MRKRETHADTSKEIIVSNYYKKIGDGMIDSYSLALINLNCIYYSLMFMYSNYLIITPLKVFITCVTARKTTFI